VEITMTKAIRITETGGPEVLRWEDVEVGTPGEGQARIRHTAVGVNFIDTYQRSGLYPITLPSGMGNEAAGIVEAVGSGVTVVKPGDRVAYAGGGPGSYSEARLLPASILVPIPDGVTDKIAAAIMLKGMTSQYLIRRTYPAKAGETVLFHAAAGGVGLIACQWLKALGATVIGTVGSDEKAEIAKAHGCEHVIISTKEDIAKRVREITGGAGVPVVYDSVGKDTFLSSLDCLKPLGLLVSFGNSSGKVTPFDIGILSQKGSLYLTRPTLATYTATRPDLEATAKDVFEEIRDGKVKVEIRHTYPLAEAAQVHRDLEGRKTVGSIVMVP
jgi:NADPH:quinone reductase